MSKQRTLDITLVTDIRLDGSVAPRGTQLPGHDYSQARMFIAANQAVEGLVDLDAKPSEAAARERFELLVGAVPDVSPDDYTQGGKPEVAALEAASGLSDVSAAERDSVWTEFKARADEQAAQ